MNPIGIGILAEDKTDCHALTVLVRRIVDATNGRAIRTKLYSGKGCARLRKNAEAPIADMVAAGCSAVLIVHDLDRNPRNGALNDEGALRKELTKIVVPKGIKPHICIPVEELEAWFWADEHTIKKATRGNEKAKAQVSPHLLAKPKEMLERMSRGPNGKARYNTNENVELAEVLDLRICESRCPSFRELAEFVRSLVA